MLIRLITLCLPLIWIIPMFAQSGKVLELKTCHSLAMQNDPINEQGAILERIHTLNLENIHSDFKPGIEWNSRASLQTENVSLPFQIPGQAPIDLPLFGFKTALNANYVLYDGGIRNSLEVLEAAHIQIQLQEILVEKDKLKLEINQYYYKTLLFQKQLSILKTSKEDLSNKIETLKGAAEFGVVIESDMDKLLLQDLKLQAAIEELESMISKFKLQMAYLIDTEISDSTFLVLPDDFLFEINSENQREEMKLFDLKNKYLQLNNDLLEAKDKPRIASFLETGIGYPNPLNFFEEELSPFAMGGVQLKWKIVDWGRKERDKELIQLQSHILANQQKRFKYKLNQIDSETSAEIKKIRNLISTQKEIVLKQKEIISIYSEQLNYGVISANDYLSELNAGIVEETKLESLIIQLNQIQINYLTAKGRF